MLFIYHISFFNLKSVLKCCFNIHWINALHILWFERENHISDSRGCDELATVLFKNGNGNRNTLGLSRYLPRHQFWCVLCVFCRTTIPHCLTVCTGAWRLPFANVFFLCLSFDPFQKGTLTLRCLWMTGIMLVIIWMSEGVEHETPSGLKTLCVIFHRFSIQHWLMWFEYRFKKNCPSSTSSIMQGNFCFIYSAIECGGKFKF